MRFLHIYLFFIMMFFHRSLSAQYYDTGQDPANIRWLQIRTDRFRVIYPESYGKAGVDFTRSLESAFSDLSTLFPVKKFKIPVIIHNYTTQSNGYVAWAPRRMEIFPTPEQNSVPEDPNTQLTHHELTHVFQMVSLSKGFTRAGSLFFGEQFPGAVSSLLPLWYLEGDAIFSESIFTGAGRAKSAAFAKQLKAISIEKGRMYKYDKLVNRSFRTLVPDHYQTGAQAVAFANLRYDHDVWNKVLKTTANFPFTGDPVNLSLLHSTGLTKKKLFKETFDTLHTIWNAEIERNGAQAYEPLNRFKKKKYISYHSPVSAGDNKIAAISTSLTDPPRFVLIDPLTRKEEKIHVPGRISPYFISGTRNFLVWVETQTDPRWNNRNYSVIKLMDLKERIARQLTWKTRYMSASISPDAKTIAAVENSIDNKNSLVLIDVRTEKIIKSYPSPGNAYLQRPQWSEDGTKITVISLTDKGEGILSFSITNQSWETLMDERNEDFQSTFLRNDSLFYVSSASGTENIHVLSPEKKISRITNSRFGATDLLFYGNKIVFSDYTSSGNNICQTRISDEKNHETASDAPSSFLIDGISLPEGPAVVTPRQIYAPEPYRKWQNLFRFHSWMPFYADLDEVKADPRAIRPGFTLMSQNLLSTLITSAGYEYSENRHKLHSRITWQGWYPVLESRVDYGDLNYIYKLGENVDDPEIIKTGIFHTNSISLPLTFSTGRFYQYFQPTLSALHQNTYIYLKEKNEYDYGQTQFSARFYFSNYHRSALRDIYPRIAQVLDFNYSFYPFDNTIYGSYITLRTALYFPGFLKNNGIKLRYENDKQTVEKIPLWNRINFPRSYENIASEDLSLLSADYVMPLLYPDFNFVSFFYLTRIRTGFFFDYAKGTGNYYFKLDESGSLYYDQYRNYTETFSSYGFELMADFHVFRLPYTVSAGIQTAWQRGNTTPFLKMLFNINIFGMSIGRSPF